MLIAENQDLGKQLSQGRIAQLEAELALQKKYNEELKCSQDGNSFRYFQNVVFQPFNQESSQLLISFCLFSWIPATLSAVSLNGSHKWNFWATLIYLASRPKFFIFFGFHSNIWCTLCFNFRYILFICLYFISWTLQLDCFYALYICNTCHLIFIYFMYYQCNLIMQS